MQSRRGLPASMRLIAPHNHNGTNVGIFLISTVVIFKIKEHFCVVYLTKVGTGIPVWAISMRYHFALFPIRSAIINQIRNVILNAIIF